MCEESYSGVELILPRHIAKLDIHTRLGELADYFIVCNGFDLFCSNECADTFAAAVGAHSG